MLSVLVLTMLQTFRRIMIGTTSTVIWAQLSMLTNHVLMQLEKFPIGMRSHDVRGEMRGQRI